MIEEEEEEGEDIEEVNNAEYNVFGLPGSELPPGLITNSLFSIACFLTQFLYATTQPKNDTLQRP